MGFYGVAIGIIMGKVYIGAHFQLSLKANLHMINYIIEGSLHMEKKPVDNSAVTNVFKNGRMPTREEYTKIWIDMINHITRMKAKQ